MKLTKTRLKQLIAEELKNLKEAEEYTSPAGDTIFDPTSSRFVHEYNDVVNAIDGSIDVIMSQFRGKDPSETRPIRRTVEASTQHIKDALNKLIAAVEGNR